MSILIKHTRTLTSAWSCALFSHFHCPHPFCACSQTPCTLRWLQYSFCGAGETQSAAAICTCFQKNPRSILRVSRKQFAPLQLPIQAQPGMIAIFYT